MTVKMEKHTARKYSSPIRERQANQTRTNILDATQRLFLERGYAKTTVEAIAQEAGVAKQTVYAVFRSKNGIVAELLDRPSSRSGCLSCTIAHLKRRTSTKR